MPTQTPQQALGAKLDRLTEAIEQLHDSTSQHRANPATGQSFGARLDKIDTALEEIRHGRTNNPGGCSEGASSARALRRVAKLRTQREEILDALGEMQNALDECEYDEAQEILEDILEDYESEQN